LSKKPRDPRKIPVDPSLLSEEDKLALRKSAASTIKEEMAQDARDAYFAKQIADLRRKQIPEERLVTVTINLAPFIPFLLLDQDQYFADYTYDVPASRAAVLYEQMQRSWAHQDEIDGRSRFNAYRRPNNQVIGRGQANTPTRGSNGIITLDTSEL
jgi:hypothetical protein